MIERIIFHCGTHKTGSSSIQNWLYDNREAHLSEGLLYPNTGLTSLEYETGHRHRELVKAPLRKKVFQKIVKEIELSNAQIVVYSCETFSTQGRAKNLRRLVQRLQLQFGISAEAVIYFRNLDDYARAHYREFTNRWGNNNSFSTYFNTHYRKLQMDYLGIAKSIHDVFDGHVIFRNFEEIDNVCPDFANTIGYSELFEPDENTHIKYNQSIDAVMCEILRWINKQEINDDQERKLRAFLLKNSPFKDSEKYGKFIENTDIPFLRPSAEYRDEFAKISGFSQSDIDLIFEPRAPDKSFEITNLQAEIEEYCEEAAVSGAKEWYKSPWLL